MGFANFKSPIGLCKLSSLVLGFIVLCVGCTSHFESEWVKIIDCNPLPGSFCVTRYDSCKYNMSETCPDICMERFYIGVIILCFVLSVVGVVVTFFSSTGSAFFKAVDLGYHVESAALLVVGAILYITSAEQIDSIYNETANKNGWNFRRSEKLASASLSIFQAILHGVIAFLIIKAKGS